MNNAPATGTDAPVTLSLPAGLGGAYHPEMSEDTLAVRLAPD
jgi:hypothetical protein